ncbi:MAG: hypothetical protein ACR2MA_03480 [Egibacteraceae bacterium]
MAPVQREWMDASTALTVRHADEPGSCSADETAQLVERLGALARTLVAEGGADQEADQELERIPGWAAARAVATQLAEQTRGEAVTVLTGGELAQRYLEALRDAAGAVHYCRTVQHTSRSCWFSTAGPGAGLCGRVLIAAHRLRLPIPA